MPRGKFLSLSFFPVRRHLHSPRNNNLAPLLGSQFRSNAPAIIAEVDEGAVTGVAGPLGWHLEHEGHLGTLNPISNNAGEKNAHPASDSVRIFAPIEMSRGWVVVSSFLLVVKVGHSLKPIVYRALQGSGHLLEASLVEMQHSTAVFAILQDWDVTQKPLSTLPLPSLKGMIAEGNVHRVHLLLVFDGNPLFIQVEDHTDWNSGGADKFLC